MDSRKFSFLLFSTILCFFLGNTQEKLNETQQKELKSQVIKNAEKTESIISDFTQEKYLSIMEDPIISEGKLAYKSPNLVKWEYTLPYKNIAIFKDNKLYVTNDGKKDKLDLSSNKLFRSLNTLIVNSIKGDMFDDSQFEISYFKNETGYLVKFIPRDKRLKKFIARFELQFSKSSVEVQKVKLIEPNEDYTLITFKNRQLNTTVSKAIFNH